MDCEPGDPPLEYLDTQPQAGDPPRRRTLSGAQALDRLRPAHPGSQRVLRADVGPLPGAQPPHQTETSIAPWWGAQVTRTDLGEHPTFRQVADSHAWISEAGVGLHGHHEIERISWMAGAANVSACQAAWEAIIAGTSKVPLKDQPAVRAHLEKHLRDAGAEIPRSGLEHTSGRAAQLKLEEGATARTVAERFEELQVMDRYFDALEELQDRQWESWPGEGEPTSPSRGPVEIPSKGLWTPWPGKRANSATDPKKDSRPFSSAADLPLASTAAWILA